MNIIVITILIYMSSRIGNGQTPSKNLKIIFSDTIAKNKTAETQFQNNFKNVTKIFNPELIRRPFDLIGALLQDFKIYYITRAHMCYISKHNNIIQYINIENMGDREGTYFRLIHYIQYTFNI